MVAQLLDNWKAVVSLLPADWRQLADEHRQLQTQYGNAKITNADDLLRLILVHAATDLPLRQTVALVAESGGPDVSSVTLHKKMSRAAAFLHALVKGVVHIPSEVVAEKWGGYDVTAVDGSTICRPGSVSGDARIHTRLRLSTLEYLEVFTTTIKVGESFLRFLPARDELVLADRLYCNPRGVAHVVDSGAAVLVRFNRKSLPVLHNGETVDLLPLLRSLRGMGVHERDVSLPVKSGGETRFISGRLVMQKLPPEKAEQARKSLRQERGPKLSPASWEAAGYVVMFTTAPSERLTAGECMTLYRLRWQIELQFKRWKSVCGFDRMPNFKPETIVAWLYAKILAVMLLERLATQHGEVFSPIRREWFEDQSTSAVESDPIALAALRIRNLADDALRSASQRRTYH